MYRHAASLRMSPSPKTLLPSPAPEELSDSEAEICFELENKRKQIEEEIARFKAHKEKEFRDFEKDLRFKRKQSRSANTRDPPLVKSPSKSAGVLSLLAGLSKDPADGVADKSNQKKGGVESLKGRKTPPPSKATLSLDKLNITSVPATPGTDTPPAALSKNLSRSPTSTQMALTPPRYRAAKTTPNTSERNDTSLAGLFMPAYLPLLDHRHDNSTPPIPTYPQKPPMTPEDSTESISQSPTLKLLSQQKRALTAPVLPSPVGFSANLPSALRTASGGNLRKRKRVTFQLADSAIVEPSSSYEETASPSPRIISPVSEDGGSSGERNGIDEAMGRAVDAKDFGEIPRVNGHADVTDDVLDEDADGADLSRQSSHSSGNLNFVGIQLLDPRRKQTRSESESSVESAGSGSANGTFSGGLREAVDGGSGVGFFELDEELESPGLRETSPFGEEDEMDVEPNGKKVKGEGQKDELLYDSFSAGSLPINIVSKNFVGSYGH